MGNGTKEDELQSILNFIVTVNEVSSCIIIDANLYANNVSVLTDGFRSKNV